MKIKVRVRVKGGPGSGNYGHSGRPGSVGGSMPRSHSMSLRTGPTWMQRYEAASGKKHPEYAEMKKFAEEYNKKVPPTPKARGKKVISAGRDYVENNLGNNINDDFSAEAYGIILDAIGRLPESHVKCVTMVGKSSYDRGTIGSCDMSGNIHMYDNIDGSRSWDAAAITHEVGHAVQYNLLDGIYDERARTVYNSILSRQNMTQKDALSNYRDSYTRRGTKKVPGFPTYYSQTSHRELFAESYQMFIHNPSKLKKSSPDMYSMMTEVFGI